MVHLVKTIAPWSVEMEIMVENYNKYNEIINQIRREFADVLINVESTNLGQDYVFPAKNTVFD